MKNDQVEKMMKAIFGDDDKAREEARKYKEKKKEQMKEALDLAKEIMEENHIGIKDIPKENYIGVTAYALNKQVINFADELAMTTNMLNKNKYTEILEDSAYSLVQANIVYRLVCEMFEGTDILEKMLSKEYHGKYDELLKKAKSICVTNTRKNQEKERNIFAHMIPAYASMEFNKKDAHTVSDATWLIASYIVKDSVIRENTNYNVLEAEKRIYDLIRYNHYKQCKDIPENILRATMPRGAVDHIEVFEKMAEEIEKIMEHTEESFGYRLNYIKSGQKKYQVFKWHGEMDNEETEMPTGTLIAEDKGEYDTKEEAERNAEPDDEIEEYDPEEMWAIVDSNGNNPTKMIYPTKERAAVFLIRILGKEKLPAWFTWEKIQKGA